MNILGGIHAFFTVVDESCSQLWRAVRPEPRIVLTELEAAGLFQIRVERGTDVLCNDQFYISDLGRTVSGSSLDEYKGFPVHCFLKTSNFFFHKFSFPSQLTLFVDKLVDSQIDQFVPWPRDRFLLGRTEVSVDPSGSYVTVAAVDRSWIDGVTTALMSIFDREPTYHTLSDGKDIAPIQIDDRSTQQASSSHRSRSEMTFAFIAGFAVLINIGLWLYSIDLDRTIEVLRSNFSQQKSALSSSGNKAPGGNDLLIAKKVAARGITVILEDLATLLPDHTWIRDLDYSEGQLNLDGLSQDAASLIRALEKSPNFSSAEFSGVTERDRESGLERFKIRVGLAGEQGRVQTQGNIR